MTEIKDLYNLNQRTISEKHACLNKQKEHIAKIDTDIANFLDASDPVQVYIIRVLADKHREVCRNNIKKTIATMEERVLINQKKKENENSMQDVTYDSKEKIQNIETRMELE